MLLHREGDPRIDINLKAEPPASPTLYSTPAPAASAQPIPSTATNSVLTAPPTYLLPSTPALSELPHDKTVLDHVPQSATDFANAFDASQPTVDLIMNLLGVHVSKATKD